MGWVRKVIRQPLLCQCWNPQQSHVTSLSFPCLILPLMLLTFAQWWIHHCHHPRPRTTLLALAMVRYTAFGQDHDVRSFLESLADAAVAHGGVGRRACSRDRLQISIPAVCLLDYIKDCRRPVTLSYHSRAGFLRAQCAASLIDRDHDKV